MASTPSSDFITEPARQRPVLHDVDVAVAGSGLCGTFAAIAAGRCGARTLVIDRFGALGGNIGPGMIINGSLDGEAEVTLPGGLSGIPGEFMERLQALLVGSARRYPEEASIASHLAYEMMKDAGVGLLLSAYAADPILEGGTVCGLFVEVKSGRAAIEASATVDGTGDADIARRAGAPMVSYLAPDDRYEGQIRSGYLDKKHPTYYNDTQILCLIADADLETFEQFCQEETDLTDEEAEWAERMFASYPRSLVPALHQGWTSGEFRPTDVVEPNVSMSTGRAFPRYGDGVVGLHITCRGAIDAGDPAQISRLEGRMREQAMKAVLFYRHYMPGFEKAYLLTCSAFLGMRGGPHIDGEHTLTPDEAFSGRKCVDVLFRNTHEMGHGGDPSGFDVPYGIVLPKDLDGLLVCGRGAAYLRRGHDPTGMRARPSMMVFGQAVGTAAATAALDHVSPKEVDIQKVQRRLVADGLYLGDQERLRELGIA